MTVTHRICAVSFNNLFAQCSFLEPLRQGGHTNCVTVGLFELRGNVCQIQAADAG